MSVNTSNTEYTSIYSLSSAEHDTADPTSQYDNSPHISTDSEDDNIVGLVSLQAEKPRICQAKQAHELVLRETDASLVKKLLTTSDAPHLDTKALIQKLDEVSKTVNLDVSTFHAKQHKYPVLGIVRFGFAKTLPRISSHQRSNSLKVSYDIVNNSTDYLLKTNDSSFATMKLRTN